MTIDSLCNSLADYLDFEQIRQVRRAYFYSEQAHTGQSRRSGEPYIIHPLAVAGVLADMRMDHQSLQAALLHDVIEDTGVSKRALTAQFGAPVADLVDGVSKLTHIQFETAAEQQAENFQKMALAMAKDIRVVMVKLADRLHNMRTIGALKPEKRRRIGRETLDIYAPIANRLGMYEMRSEMQELSYRALHPMRLGRLEQAVAKIAGNRKRVVEEIATSIENRLAEFGLKGHVIGREKKANSIYRKMKDQHKSFAEIMDVYGFRVITESVDDCYRVLGAMHGLFKPRVGRFKDYIAIPKANGYQSLHTTLVGMHGIPIEIQIRTEEMERMAAVGIAAHWLYKEGQDGGTSDRAHRWVRDLMELQQRAGDSLEFIENAKVDLFPDEVYVFTPKGKILELQRGATAVDFAYAVHTDVGNRCVACRVDRTLAPLSRPLESGQTVEVLTAPNARPSSDWLNFVTTGKARAAIRHTLKTRQRSESIKLGERLLGRALTSFGLSHDDITDEQRSEVLEVYSAETWETLLEQIGLGDRFALTIANRLSGELTAEAGDKPLAIAGTEGVVISYGKCCMPIAGDPIIGSVSRGKGVVVHRERCRNIAETLSDPERTVAVTWADDVQGEFETYLTIEVENTNGVIAQMAAAIADADASIEGITREERDARLSVVRIAVSVRDRLHLSRVMRRLRAQKCVLGISRGK
ncbi:RelA/SpoT family protein [Litorivicinus lipolyticus]|uniref:guanosine-3',5'-bis(diphosphate) 3'-diphosphatase n=1 Tax=Litorivicinus lipolyticus TaxID=418701 RepID=A0A5Q2Q854_9GAMM|nr:RelA/SpoT family protein [Litorivicinus lipolyticus]QGG79203.1 RelA/SpoT family protein [Litorivicinus lipolyticus]